MKYCEACHRLCQDAFCPECGGDVLREVLAEDYCFLMTCQDTFGEVLKQALLDLDIPCILMPFGNGVRNALGLNLGGYKVYVPYQYYEEAKDTCDMLTVDASDELRMHLLAHRKLWHAKSKFSLNRMRKKLGLSKEDDVLAHIENVVIFSMRITDKGVNLTCPHGGHDLAVAGNDMTIWFNSVTFEVAI